MREKLVNIIFALATKPSRLRRFMTPVAMLLFFLTMSALITLLVIIEKDIYTIKIIPRFLKLLLSLPLMATGIFLMFWSNLHFFKVKGSPVPFNPPPRVVSSGPYVYVRNPMFLGLFILILGLGVFFESWILVFILLPILIVLVVWELKTIEEPELEKRLGSEYVEYKKRTPLLFPKRLRPSPP